MLVKSSIVKGFSKKTKLSIVKPSDARARTHTRGARHFRELSVVDYRILASHCKRYAERWFFRHGLPLCDLEDAVVNATDSAYERIARAKKIRRLEAFMAVTAYRSVATELRKRKYRRNAVWIDAVPLEPQLDPYDTNPDDEQPDGGFFISDEGEGARRIVESAAERTDPAAVPQWLMLFRRTLALQKGKAKKVIAALRKDSRHVVAAEISGIPRRTFQRILKKIQSDFTPCLQAYREFSEE